mmetsp:Transcript_41895/g.61293  ORF Transcript_41895/g.61293 Transcript_41895/m.61293 type:complete len:340 (+) Transcript_41895:211-1230(+)
MRFSLVAFLLPWCSKTASGFSPSFYSSIATSFYHHQHNMMHCKQMITVTSPLKVTATKENSENTETQKEKERKEEELTLSPWSMTQEKGGGINEARFRQHVNPLSRKYQMQTELPPNWPADGSTFADPSLPLYLDIGCGKGGFLLDLATKRVKEEEEGNIQKMNYLGLEIRPNVVAYAQERVPKWNLAGKLSFVGCNANVDLDRILSLYCSEEKNNAPLEYVSIQYPDPHFKNRHEKRRVVTPELVSTVAKYLPEGKVVFLQSDIQSVLDTMRERFREQSIYFEDEIESVEEYMDVNPLGVPTERELSVLKKDLPVFRTILRRTSVPFDATAMVDEEKK